MDINNYINTLEYLLETNKVRRKSAKYLIDTYTHYYKELAKEGLSYVEIVNRLGTPMVVFQNHMRNLTYYPRYREWLMFLSPLISMILFLLLHLTWQQPLHLSSYVFILIPLAFSNYLFKGPFRVVIVTVFLCLFAYFLTGHLTTFYDPLWLLFFIIPVLIVLLYSTGAEMIVGLILFISVPVMYLLNYYQIVSLDLSWQILLLIPLLYYVLEKIDFTKLIGLSALIVSMISYNTLLIGFEVSWQYGIYTYLLWPAVMLISGEFLSLFMREDFPKVDFVYFIGSISLYISSSLILGIWTYTLFILLIIPIYYILKARYLDK